MKKLITLLMFTIVLFSCNTYKTLSKEELNRFTSKNDTISYDGQPVAVFLNIEWEYYRKHKTMEISVERIGGGADEMTDKIVDYIRTKHPNAKAEVKIPR